MNIIQGKDAYAIRKNFLSAFIPYEPIVDYFLADIAKGKKACEMRIMQNRLIWEYISVDGWHRCDSYESAISLLDQIAGEIYVITDGDNGAYAHGLSPIFLCSPHEAKKLFDTRGLWNFYVFDSTLSWVIAFTDECEAGHPNGVCFTTIRN